MHGNAEAAPGAEQQREQRQLLEPKQRLRQQRDALQARHATCLLRICLLSTQLGVRCVPLHDGSPAVGAVHRQHTDRTAPC